MGGRRREMAVLAADGECGLRPGDVRLRAALGVAVDGAGAAGAVVGRLPRHEGRIERDLDDAVAVLAPDHGIARYRVAGRARHSAGLLRRRLYVRRVSPAHIPGEKARIARRVGIRSRSVACRARERAAWLVMATRARRGDGVPLRDARRARRGAVVRGGDYGVHNPRYIGQLLYDSYQVLVPGGSLPGFPIRPQ